MRRCVTPLCLPVSHAGKTTIAKLAMDRLQKSNSRFIPFFVDLKQFVEPDKPGESAEEVAGRVSQAFAAAASLYEARLLDAANTSICAYVERELPSWASGLFRAAPQPSPPSLPLRDLLQQQVHLAKTECSRRSLFRLFSSQPRFVPVFIIDEVHLLNKPGLQELRDQVSK